MKIFRLLLLSSLICAVISSCTDDEHFTTNPSARLVFSSDTISFDTVFATVPTATRTFWVFNKGNDGIRLTSVRLEGGNQKGFRVNVDGSYLGASSGFLLPNVEIRKGDSIRVFVELTSPVPSSDFTKLTDQIVFTHESGVEQKVVLNACAWQATLLRNHHVTSNEILTGEKPIVIYGDLTVDAGATLTVTAGTTLYFHGDAGMKVYGRLVCEGTSDNNVVLRGDRLDKMFDYLPYDGVSGQWQGITIYEGSTDNVIRYTDIHGAMHGISLTADGPTYTALTMEMSTVHNCQGHGVKTVNAKVVIHNSQLTNTLGDCLHVEGGDVDINNCTFAQFYPFDSARGYALYFDNSHALTLMCDNSIITGYADDVLQGTQKEENNTFNYSFSYSLIRTPEPADEHKQHFTNIIFEDIKETDIGGMFNFAKIDNDSLRYDFQLSDSSLAIDSADPHTALSIDRRGITRDDKPDMGCFEKIKENTESKFLLNK